MTLTFLTLDEVLALHADQIERYGGSLGVRDVGLLQSALAMPGATFGGQHLHASLAEMGAAYTFHLAKNHPFVDGNKRAALIAALVFFRLDGVRLRAPAGALERVVIGVADGTVSKAQLGVFFETHLVATRD